MVELYAKLILLAVAASVVVYLLYRLYQEGDQDG